jgi:hypothetical protein
MTPQEFKAWFEGFSEGIEGTPTQAQWKKVCERVKAIVPAPPVSYPVYVERYWPGWPYHRAYVPYPGSLYQGAMCQSQQYQGYNQATGLQNVAQANNLASQGGPNVANVLRAQQQGNPNGLTLDQMRAQCSQLQQRSLDADVQAQAAPSFDSMYGDGVDKTEDVLDAMRELGRKDRSEIN